MKNTKRRVEQFLFYDAAGVEKHLATMAEKGWQLEKITPYSWHYRRAEPKKMTYAVTYFPGASDFDPAPTAQQIEYRAFCEASGWEFVVQWAQMQIFSTEKENPVPIETEELVRLETTHRAMKKNFLPGAIALLAVALLQIAVQLFAGNYDLIGKLADGSRFYLLFLIALMLAMPLILLLGYRNWYRTSKQSVERGGPCATCGGGYRKWMNALYLPLGIVAAGWLWEVSRQGTLWAVAPIFVMLTLLSCSVSCIRDGLHLAHVSRKWNRGITVAAIIGLTVVMMAAVMSLAMMGVSRNWFRKQPVEQIELDNFGHTMTWDVYHDPLPLKVEDLMAVDYPHYSYEGKEEASPLVVRYTGEQNSLPDGNDAPEITYEIVDVKVDFFYDLCLKQYTEKEMDWDPGVSFQSVDPTAWQADAAYQQVNDGALSNSFVLCWGQRIVKLRFPYDWNLTAEQMATVAEKLRP